MLNVIPAPKITLRGLVFLRMTGFLGERLRSGGAFTGFLLKPAR